MIRAIDGSSALPLEYTANFSPLEWTDADEAFPFAVPEWASLGLEQISPRIMGRHWLVLGDTGSGKTKSVIVPVLGAALRYRNGESRHRAAVLVVDPKFELGALAEAVLAEQSRTVIRLSVENCERRIALFEGVQSRYHDPLDAVEYTLQNCSPAYAGAQNDREPFWRISGFQIIQALVGTDVSARAQCNTGIWSLLLSTLGERERQLLRGYGVSTRDENYYENAYGFCSAAINNPQLLLRFADVAETHGVTRAYVNTLRGIGGAPENQRGSQLSTAFQFLGELAHRELNAVVDLRPPGTGRGAGEYLSIRRIVENGEVLHFSPGFGSAVYDLVGRIVKTKFFEASFARRNKARAVFYICDEFQRFITSDPQSGEQSFLDRCRAYRVTCALATQSIASLEYGLRQSGEPGDVRSALGILMNNTGNKLFFRNTDQETQLTLEHLFPRSPNPLDPSLLTLRPVSSLAVGECYYLFCDGRMGRARVQLDGSRGATDTGLCEIPKVRLAGQMTFESVLGVCDTIERLVRFQKATEINIEIESPGGSGSALQYLISKLAWWRNQGVRFHTTALLNALSAAALTLALGDLGCRRAHRFSRIMFHNGRYIPPQPLPITKEVALTLVDELTAGDGVMESMLLEHLFSASRSSADELRTIDFDSAALKELNLGISGVRVLDRELFKEVYGKIAAQERYLTAEQTLLLGLIDCVI